MWYDEPNNTGLFFTLLLLIYLSIMTIALLYILIGQNLY